jgi:hypothetical protein
MYNFDLWFSNIINESFDHKNKENYCKCTKQCMGVEHINVITYYSPILILLMISHNLRNDQTWFCFLFKAFCLNLTVQTTLCNFIFLSQMKVKHIEKIIHAYHDQFHTKPHKSIIIICNQVHNSIFSHK